MYVNLEDHNNYCVISFNTGGKYNLVNIKFMIEFLDTLAEIEKNRSYRFIMIHGENGNFGAGADIRELLKASEDKEFAISFFNYMKAMYQKLLNINKITIAQVNGVAYGASLEMLLLMDFVIAEESSKFAAPGGKIGVFPPVLVSLGPYIIGLRNVKRLAMLGEEIDSKEAKNIGLIDSYGDIKEETNSLVSKLVSFSPTALLSMKRLVLSNMSHNLDDAFESIISQVTSDNAKEGISSFLAKIKPSWTNFQF
ncbi:enoyl-CoA hydratase/isomerase family protein [Acidianus brierleyi]|uniref:Enoyl-CoA hydratase/isomerase family protein n=1 Tax=Acidianus brierleyi TaxID=41673 RepID=A0A2U9IBZ8_9CREN|nr:enoyl-CoA hydratase/isomerase family protein [Acidianus brierleyi]AWR93537.1 enoyl-CoA hydratase/isomerase family protein [Acidianus brierleyi]